MSILDRICCLFSTKSNKVNKTALDRYIEHCNPQTLEEVERLVKQYYNGASPWRYNNDKLYF